MPLPRMLHYTLRPRRSLPHTITPRGPRTTPALLCILGAPLLIAATPRRLTTRVVTHEPTRARREAPDTPRAETATDTTRIATQRLTHRTRAMTIMVATDLVTPYLHMDAVTALRPPVTCAPTADILVLAMRV